MKLHRTTPVRRVFAAVTLACLIAVVGALAGASVAFGSAAGSGSVRTIKAIAQGAGITFVDADRNGKPSIGDYEIGATVYVDPASGKPVGRGSVICTQINAAGTQYQCQGQSRFPGGNVISAGPFAATSKTYLQAVVGGTGAYEGVKGTLAGIWLDAKFARAKVVFTLYS